MRTIRVTALSLLCCLLVAAFALSDRGVIFPGGEAYTFYLHSASSSAESVRMEPDEAWRKIFLSDCVGESTIYEGDVAERILREYGGTILFTEVVAGVTNDYCYSPRLGGGIFLCGVRINLHIARTEQRTAVGTPLIFGGY